jgi:hypothetical protein
MLSSTSNYRAVPHLFLPFVEIVKKSNSWYISSATNDLFCFAKYEFFNSSVEMGVILKFFMFYLHISWL